MKPNRIEWTPPKPTADDPEVAVRVLSEAYGFVRTGYGRQPMARRGEVIKVPRSAYEQAKGHYDAISGKWLGASLKLLSDETAEQAAKVARPIEDAAKNTAEHMRKRQVFADQHEQLVRSQALRQRQIADAAEREAKEIERELEKLATAKQPKGYTDV